MIKAASSALPAIGAASRILQMVPPQLLGFGAMALPFVPRDLIATTEQHTRKVARQTHMLTRQLLDDAPAGSVPLIQRLLVDAEQMGTGGDGGGSADSARGDRTDNES